MQPRRELSLEWRQTNTPGLPRLYVWHERSLYHRTVADVCLYGLSSLAHERVGARRLAHDPAFLSLAN